MSDVNEGFRELCYIGDVELIRNFYRDNKPNVNSTNRVNGWTALHWAVKRNHLKVIEYLIDIGADPTVKNSENKMPSDYVSSQPARDLLFKNSEVKPTTPLIPAPYSNEPTGFTPNYARNPEFHYSNTHLYNSSAQNRDQPDTIGTKASDVVLGQFSSEKKPPFKRDLSESIHSPVAKNTEPTNPPEYVTIKLRSHFDEDFIEIDIDKANLSIDQFKQVCNRELGEFDKSLRSIVKIRKLPNVLVRNTADIKRLKNDQEIELIYSDQI